ncbi:MAG TPA: diguanylate cyclase [Firmicutes bacterium]|jgi:oligopeptide transport system permease protein|nr:diguanylate cyclase [Bacillota bacterium]
MQIQYDPELFEVVGSDRTVSDSLVKPSITYWQDAWRRLRKNKVALISLYVLIVIMLLCAFIPIFSKTSFTEQATELANQPPSAQHWFGMDELGRDIFVRIWLAGRVSIIIGLGGALISLIIGSLYGGISGYVGGLADDIMMRIVEVILGIPYLIIVVLVSLALGKGLPALIIALCITSWTDLARLVRGQVLQLKQSEYVLASRALGASPLRIILRHLLPNSMSIIIVNITFAVPIFIFSEAFLSFIGLGIQPPFTSWGAMASLGQQQMSYYPHELIFPALAISLTMLTFNLLGDGLRDSLDPKLRQ